MKEQFSVRLSIEDKKKIDVISKENSRSINGQMEFIVKQFIKKYEDINGAIKVDFEGEISATIQKNASAVS